MSTNVDGVLDLTFLDIRSENDLVKQLTEKLTPPPAGSPTSPSKTIGFTGTLGSFEATSSPTRPKKLVVKAIRLGNNEITNMNILSVVPLHLDANKIQWIDLSFNHIVEISSELHRYFPNLTTVYLHANKIAKLSQLKKFENFEHLRSMSLYGNPVEEHKYYRNFVLYTCKNLAQFDKSPVTKSQLQKVSPL